MFIPGKKRTIATNFGEKILRFLKGWCFDSVIWRIDWSCDRERIDLTLLLEKLC
jgi:hypothetical protein